MEYEEAIGVLRSHQWHIKFGGEARRTRNPLEQLTWMQGKADGRKDLPPNFHEVWYALAQELRRVADLHEYAAMKDLSVKRQKSWYQVARALGSGKSRQAIQQRWSRLSGMQV